MSNKNNVSNAQIKLLNEAQKLAKSLGLEYNDIADAQEEILNNNIKNTEALRASLATARERLKIVREEDRATQRLLDAREQVQEADQEIAKLMSGIAKDKFKVAALSEEELNLTKDIVSKTKNQLLASRGISDSLDTQINQYIKILDKASEHISASEKLKRNYSGINLAAINDGFDELQSRIDDLTGFMPKGISKALGFDTLATDLKDAVLSGKKLPAGLGFVAAAAAVVAIYKVMQDITQQAKEFSNETGLTVAASQQLVEQSYELQASYKNQLSSQQDILSIQQQVVGQLGPMAKLSGDVALRASETGKAFGYGAQTAGEVQARLMQISGFSETAAINAQEFIAQLSLAEGVAPGAVMKDIAKSSVVAAKYFSGSPKALGKAAVEAAKLGLSLDQMATTAESLLNIEQSLEDQYAASAMLGRQLNFDTARRLALENDIAGATKEVLKELGGIEEFENASVFAKERMAKAAGMTVDQLSKSLALQELSGEFSQDELTRLSGMNMSKAELMNMDAEELRNRLAQQQATEELATSFEKIKSAMVRFILPIAKALMPIFEGLAGLVEGILAPFQIIGDLLSMFTGWISQFTGGLGMSIDMGKTLAVTLKGIGVVLGIMAIKGIISAIASIFSSLGAIPFIGIGLAAAAVGGLFAAIGAGTSMVQSKMNDGEMGPVGPSGYSRVMTGPEGSIALNDKDTVIAGTNLNGGGTTVAIDYDKLGTAVAKAIQNLKIIIDESAVAAINKRGAVQASYR
jgi:hypothetical protein